jgi:hypothetical protein
MESSVRQPSPREWASAATRKAFSADLLVIIVSLGIIPSRTKL